MNIAVVLGGDSPERDVSLASGRGIIEALRARGHQVCAVDPVLPRGSQAEPSRRGIGEQPPDELPRLPIEHSLDWLTSGEILGADVVFIALHGGAGEDGTVQALLETVGVPYAGTGVLGSALAMNKDRSKALFRDAGVRTAPHMLIQSAPQTDPAGLSGEIERRLGYPVVVKPNCQGSSVGFSFVAEPSQVGGALERGAAYGGELIVERFIAGREITAAILDGQALPLVEIVPEGGFYDYKRKYTKGTSRYIVPAGLDRAIADRIRRESVLAYRTLLCRDFARVDLRLSDEGEPYCLEVNTLPGMTELSLVPMAAEKAGIPFGELVERICMMAYARGRKRGA
jgi:D-alanine-D-alanine ligase